MSESRRWGVDGLARMLREALQPRDRFHAVHPRDRRSSIRRHCPRALGTCRSRNLPRLAARLLAILARSAATLVCSHTGAVWRRAFLRDQRVHPGVALCFPLAHGYTACRVEKILHPAPNSPGAAIYPCDDALFLVERDAPRAGPGLRRLAAALPCDPGVRSQVSLRHERLWLELVACDRSAVLHHNALSGVDHLPNCARRRCAAAFW